MISADTWQIRNQQQFFCHKQYSAWEEEYSLEVSSPQEETSQCAGALKTEWNACSYTHCGKEIK